MKNYNRRKFIKTTTISAAALTVASTLASCSDNNIESISKGKYMGGFSAPKLDTVRIAFIGVGARGSGHAKQLASIRRDSNCCHFRTVYEDLV